MPTTPEPIKAPSKPSPTTSKFAPRLEDEPQIVTRGRVSHVEFAVDQPEPMPVRTPRHKKP
jgi:hypothetical protein